MAHLLVVEDEPQLLAQLSAVLQRTKHTVSTAADGHDAIKLLGLEPGTMAPLPLPEVVILDIMMPNANGYAVVAKMQASPAANNIPVILLSGYTDLEEVFRKFKNVKAFIPKPFEPPVLLNALADVLAALRRAQPAAEA